MKLRDLYNNNTNNNKTVLPRAHTQNSRGYTVSYIRMSISNY